MKKILFTLVLSSMLVACDDYTKDEMTNIVQQKFPNAVSVTTQENGESSSSRYIWIAKDSVGSVYKISSENYGRSGQERNRFNPVAVKIIQ